MSNEITLNPGATAEPNTCGSCKFFQRKDYDNRLGPYGFCLFVFPEKMAYKSNVRAIDPKLKDEEYTGNEDQIKDTDRCDLYQRSGAVYIVQRRVAS